jgi:RHS repeat-associated protein
MRPCLNVEAHNPSRLSRAPANSPTDPNPFQYTGRESDGTGLMYYRARYYAPQWGRFISEDSGGSPYDANQYAYAGNNPVNGADPSGRLTLIGQLTVTGQVTQAATLQLTTAMLESLVEVELLAGMDVCSSPIPYRPPVMLMGTVDVGGVGAIAKGLEGVRVIVIGENMSRIRNFARSIGASWYRAWKIEPWTESSPALAMSRNTRWIRAMMKKGCQFLDIGFDPTRPVRSPYYAMETEELAKSGYPVTTVTGVK